MYPLLESLQMIAKRYLFEKKIMIVPSYLDGNTFKINLSHQGFAALNFHSSTLFDVAKEACFDTLLKKGLKILDSSLGQVLILHILKELSSRGKLIYFKLPLITPGLAKSIFRTIKEMRVSGYSSLHWYDEFISDSGKMKDLFQIMLDYEKQLRNRNLIDEAGLYSLAKRTTEKEDKPVYLVTSNIQMNELEMQFFHEKIKPTAHILELACPEATIDPYSFSLTDCQTVALCPEKKIVDFLYRRDKFSDKLPDLNVEFYQTYGEYTEAKEVLRMIAEKGIPYDLSLIHISEPTRPY